MVMVHAEKIPLELTEVTTELSQKVEKFLNITGGRPYGDSQSKRGEESSEKYIIVRESGLRWTENPKTRLQ